MADPTPQATPEQIQQVIDTVVHPAPATDGTPIEFKTDTGQVFKGRDWQEIAMQMKKSVESGTTTIHTLNTQVETLRQQQPPTAEPAAAVNDPKTIYWEKWQRDPIEAERYADSIRLGVPEDQVDTVLRGTMHSASAAAQATAANEFVARCPDFPQTPQAVQLLTNRLSQRFGNVRPTADHLELAYYDLVRSGLITPNVMPVEEIVGRPAPIPSLGGGGGNGTAIDFESQFRSLPTDKMKEAIEELHRRGLR